MVVVPTGRVIKRTVFSRIVVLVLLVTSDQIWIIEAKAIEGSRITAQVVMVTFVVRTVLIQGTEVLIYVLVQVADCNLVSGTVWRKPGGNSSIVGEVITTVNLTLEKDSGRTEVELLLIWVVLGREVIVVWTVWVLFVNVEEVKVFLVTWALLVMVGTVVTVGVVRILVRVQTVFRKVFEVCISTFVTLLKVHFTVFTSVGSISWESGIIMV